MITYWAPEEGCFGFRDYLGNRGAPIADRARVRAYESLVGVDRMEASAHVFSGLDQLGPCASALVGDLIDRIRTGAPGWTMLNDPRRVLGRTRFLEAMAAAGLNDFRAFPARHWPADVRFPVFVRQANQHTGPLTRLLETPRAVDAAIRALAWRGFPREELLVVEYLSTADAQGRFRKFSAYRVGRAIVRTHLMISHHWAVKSEFNETTLEAAREGADYLAGTDHEAWLRQVFDLAGVEYGRIDYGLLGDRPQAWEINTNPTIGRRPGRPVANVSPEIAEIREASRVASHARLREAFVALDAHPRGDPLDLRLPASLVRAAGRERRARGRLGGLVRGLRQAYHSTVLGWPARFLYRHLLSRG